MTDQEFMMKYYGDIIEELISLTGVVNWTKTAINSSHRNSRSWWIT